MPSIYYNQVRGRMLNKLGLAATTDSNIADIRMSSKPMAVEKTFRNFKGKQYTPTNILTSDSLKMRIIKESS